jgi:hypothetical protein
MRISEIGSDRSIVKDFEEKPRSNNIDGRDHTPSHVVVRGGGDNGFRTGGQEFKYKGHGLFGGLDFADHGVRTASADLEPSVVQGLDRSGLHTPGVAGGAAEEQGEVAGERIQPSESWLSGGSVQQRNYARIRAPGRADLVYCVPPLPAES